MGWYHYLEVQVVDRGVSPKAIVANTQVGVVGLQAEVQGEQDGRRVRQLGQAVEHAGDEQHVAVLNGAHIDEHQVGAGPCAGTLHQAGLVVVARLKLEQHLRGQWEAASRCGVGWELWSGGVLVEAESTPPHPTCMDDPLMSQWLKHITHLLHVRLVEVELVLIKGLAHLRASR